MTVYTLATELLSFLTQNTAIVSYLKYSAVTLGTILPCALFQLTCYILCKRISILDVSRISIPVTMRYFTMSYHYFYRHPHYIRTTSSLLSFHLFSMKPNIFKENKTDFN